MYILVVWKNLSLTERKIYTQLQDI